MIFILSSLNKKSDIQNIHIPGLTAQGSTVNVQTLVNFNHLNIMQKFIARDRRDFSNGAVGFAPGGPFDCLGPYAKVLNCPIHGTDLRRACYATGYADTYFSIPACTRVKGKYISGYLTGDGLEGGVEFRPHTIHFEHLGIPARN